MTPFRTAPPPAPRLAAQCEADTSVERALRDLLVCARQFGNRCLHERPLRVVLAVGVRVDDPDGAPTRPVPLVTRYPSDQVPGMPPAPRTSRPEVGRLGGVDVHLRK